MTLRAGAITVLLLLLAACGDPGVVEWRDLTLALPEGWHVTEQRDTVLTISNGDAVPEFVTEIATAAPTPVDGPGAREVLVQFLVVPNTTPDSWRQLVTGDGGTIEEDTSIELSGAIGTRLSWLWTTNGIPIREMIVIIPARQLEILFQPVARAGQTDAPDVFDEHVEEFEAIINSMRFGAPVD